MGQKSQIHSLKSKDILSAAVSFRDGISDIHVQQKKSMVNSRNKATR